jgi:hypothetical protein
VGEFHDNNNKYSGAMGIEKSTQMVTLEITIPTASTWPTRDELIARNTVEKALNEAGIGKVTGAGGGMGDMHLAYRIDDETKIVAARAAIDRAMKTHMASFQYKVRVLT